MLGYILELKQHKKEKPQAGLCEGEPNHNE